MQGIKFVIHVFILEILRVDLVLGVQWLAELGNIITNYKEMTLSFIHEGQSVVLQGNNSLNMTEVSSIVFRKILHSESVARLFIYVSICSKSKHFGQ